MAYRFIDQFSLQITREFKLDIEKAKNLVGERCQAVATVTLISITMKCRAIHLKMLDVECFLQDERMPAVKA